MSTFRKQRISGGAPGPLSRGGETSLFFGHLTAFDLNF